MGLGITREVLGDILLPRPETCQVVVLREALPILLSQWEAVGRYKARPEEIPLERLSPGYRGYPPAGRGDRRGLFHVPGQGRCSHRLGKGVPQP